MPRFCAGRDEGQCIRDSGGLKGLFNVPGGSMEPYKT